MATENIAQAAAAPGALLPRVELLDHAVLRAAAWPIETLAPFEAPALAGAAAAVLEAEQRVLARREATVAALHAAIPACAARSTRAYLLSVKRFVHGGTVPLPPPPSAAELAPDSPLGRLLADEDTSRRALAERRAAFDRLHDELLEQQRRALRTAAGMPRFRKALLFANPLVAARWEAADEPVAPTAKLRRLEATIFHYLMRAIGRTTPHGAWAGVAPVLLRRPLGGITEPGTAARFDVTVNLRPFTLMLRHLERQPRYRRDYPLRLNPTLHAAERGWRYEREAGGVTNWATLEPHPLYTLILDHFADGYPRRPGSLLDAVEQASGGQAGLRSALERLIDALLDRDVLRSDLGLPPLAGSVWEALAAVVERLVEPDRGRWSATVERIRALCSRLGTELDDLEPPEIEAQRQAIETEVRALWEETGLAGAPPAPLLRLDLRSPLALAGSDDLIAAASRALEGLLAFHAADGGAELLRRISLQDVAEAAGVGDVVPVLGLLAGRLPWNVATAPQAEPGDADPRAAPDTRETIFGDLPPDTPLGAEARAHCLAWERLLEPVHAFPSFTLPAHPADPAALPGPGGAVLLKLASGTDLWFNWGRPEPALFAGRFAEVLREPPGGDPPLIVGLRERLEARAGVTPAEVVGWVPMEPNVAIRPRLTPAILDAHGLPGANLRELSLFVDADSLRPWLRGPRAPGLLAPVYNSSAALGFHDRCQRLLLRLAWGHGWALLAHGIPASRAERTRWLHRPRLRLPGGTVVSPERWTIERSVLARLAGLRGSERYLEWRREAQRHGLPPLVHARCGPLDDELLLRTDSPLAIRCLFDTLAARAPWLELAELPGDPLDWPVRDEAGQHYLAELAVTWFDDGYWEAAAPAPPEQDHGA